MAFWFRGVSLALLAGVFFSAGVARADRHAQLNLPGLRLIVSVTHIHSLLLELQQAGGKAAAAPARASGSPAHITGITVHAGEMQAELRGVGLAQVANVTVNSVAFTPGPVTRAIGNRGGEETIITAQSSLKLKLGAAAGVDVFFRDGHVSHFDVTVQPPRAEAELVNKTIEGATASGIQLSDANDVPQTATLVFSVRMLKNSGSISAIEVATENESHATELTETNGGLSGLTARLSPVKAFGQAVFGPLKFRVLEGDSASDWVPLATVVRTPHLASLSCSADLERPCTLSGSNLFLLESVAADSSYQQSVTVPANFRGGQLQVPYPAEEGMVVRLRDEPTVIDPVTLPMPVEKPVQ